MLHNRLRADSMFILLYEFIYLDSFLKFNIQKKISAVFTFIDGVSIILRFFLVSIRMEVLVLLSTMYMKLSYTRFHTLNFPDEKL